MAEQPEGLFVGLDLTDIQAIQSAAVNLLKQGKTMMTASVGGKSFSNQFPLPVDKVLRECRYAIQLLQGQQQVRRVSSDFSRRRYPLGSQYDLS
jgi:hypothetical protein